MNNYLLLILGMAAATYIPRLIPFVMITNMKLPDRLRQFLKYIPCTALGALIVPGVFTATPQRPLASIIGVIFAFIYGWFKGGIIVPVLGSIVIAFLVLSI